MKINTILQCLAIATFLPVGVNVDAAKTKQMQFRFQQQLQGKSIA